MDLAVFDPQELVAVARALRDVGQENGTFTEAERDLVEGIARIHRVVLDASALPPITPAELAAALRSPHQRKRAVQLAIVMSLVEGTPTAATERAVAELARALDVSDGGLRVMRELVHGHVTLARFDMGRRIVGAVARNQSVAGVLRTFLPTLGLGTSEATADRYRALGACAPGTVGRAFHDHYREHGFAFPGEKNAIPERAVFHDVGHLLSGYGVDPAGEIQQASFQAGFMRNDGFVFLLFGILQFHVGIKVTPIAAAESGFFDVKRVLRAVERGAACTVDLTDGFDLFAVADVPLDELRVRYGVPPLN
jgi:hypothetical protein